MSAFLVCIVECKECVFCTLSAFLVCKECVFCTFEEQARLATGKLGSPQAGFISAFVMGAGMGQATLECCVMCERVLGRVMDLHNAQFDAVQRRG
jgi:hypothetical protein